MFSTTDKSGHVYAAKTFAVPDEAGARYGISLSWMNGDKFAVFPSKRKNQTKNRPKIDDTFSEPSKVHAVRRNITIFSPILRKLVNESNGAFLILQKKASFGNVGAEILKCSRSYRSIVRECLENLQEAIERTHDNEEKEDILNYISIFYSVECIWHLCEILFVDNVPGDVVLSHLLEWVRFHFPRHERSAAQILEACERGSEIRDDYWDTVIGLLVQGRIDIARALLKLHSDSDTNSFIFVDNALRTMPSYSVYGGISAAEFSVNWKHWQLDCLSKINTKSFQSEPNLELIMRLLVGEHSAFECLRDKYESWYDVIGAYILYTDPTVKRQELGRLARNCASIMSSLTGHIKQLDYIILSLMECELHQVIHDIQNFTDNGWFVTHLTDLLYHCGKLQIIENQQHKFTDQLREGFILEYGTSMMEHRSLWQVGLSYLGQVPGEGSKRAELLLERLPLGSERRILKIIHEAKKYNLHEVVKTVCTVACVRNFQRWRSQTDPTFNDKLGRDNSDGAIIRDDSGAGRALAWAIRGRCAGLAAKIANHILEAYMRDGILRCSDALLSLGKDMFITERLVFLGKYSEFHKLYKTSQFADAATLLVSLMSSQITPEFFWPTLMTDALPLLECDTPVFSSDSTYEILKYLEEYITEKDLDEKLELLRYAILRNLARTIVDKNTEDDCS